ncbi:aminoglycoside phosphotransferase family protein [Myxococcus landrumensis]|uniref:APH(6) family putative aminoglycoside O-phosphotransferase n=1 Tax=Myxococcus landrumensis TaxID=2813577 RepID=A0ABX7NF32_9BACT|nr:aminoglycoside phosphotransferase family protein [Myxococcus landrumus]QSQ17008.1 APH(6) family putative aminoglycoside O-phosphotransferase [Myxococcus landrumus]
MFDAYLTRWNLTPEGEPITTWGSQLLPVRWRGQAAMLKVSQHPEEKFGGLLMTWWEGQGAARVLESSDEAILLERAQGERSLAQLARTGHDDEATRILCDAIAAIHTPRPKPLPELIPLSVWFRELQPAAALHGGWLTHSAQAARDLLASPQDVCPLHGDIHHDNVLDFGERGWLVIDPKRLLGERGFDYANLFCNPDVGAPDTAPPVATLPERFRRRLDIVLERSGLERGRLLRWILAWAGLSAVWFMSDGDGAEVDFRIAEFALAELRRGG